MLLQCWNHLQALMLYSILHLVSAETVGQPWAVIVSLTLKASVVSVYCNCLDCPWSRRADTMLSLQIGSC